MGNNGPLVGRLSADVIEMRIPTRPEYVSVLRATAGIIAGEMSFNYDEILNLRVAVSEAFMMAMSCAGPGDGVGELTVRFSIGATSLEVLIPAPRTYFHDLRGQGEIERRVLLHSLVDRLELGSGAIGEPMVRMLKHRSGGGAGAPPFGPLSFIPAGSGNMTTKGETRLTSQPPDPGRRAKNGPGADRQVADYLPLVRRICNRYKHSGEPLEDLIQVGTIGLIKANEKFDPDRGNHFVSYAVPVIVGEIKNYFRDHGWAVKVPRKLQKQDVERARDRLSQMLGRSPTIPEIAEATGLSHENIYDTIEVERYGRPLSLDAEYQQNGNDHSSTLLDYLGDDDPQFEELLERIDITNSLQCLNSRERTIIHLKYYSGLSQTAIASRLGISQMHVSRLQRDALGKLKLELNG